MASKKHSKVVNITKKQTHKYRELVVTNREREERRGKMGLGLRGVTISVKLASYKEIQSIFYNIYKWNKTFKNMSYYIVYL